MAQGQDAFAQAVCAEQNVRSSQTLLLFLSASTLVDFNEAQLVLANGRNDLGYLYENQSHRASGLNLLVAAIILWHTTYLQRAVDHLRDQGQPPAPGDLAYLSPLGWEHINLTGDYHWDTSPTLGPDQFRPLRTLTPVAAAAA